MFRSLFAHRERRYRDVEGASRGRSREEKPQRLVS